MSSAVLIPETPMLSAKRAKTHFLWRRLIKADKEYATVKLLEKPNLNVLRMMLDMNRDDEAVHASCRIMEEYENEMLDAGDFREVEYRQKSINEFAGDDYEGARFIGRAFTFSKLNYMNRKIVNTMYRNSHQEVDMRCAYQSMVVNAFGHLEIPAMELMVKDTRPTINSLAHDLSMDPKEVKLALLACMCSAPKFSYGIQDEDICRRISSHPFIDQYKKDVLSICQEMKVLYPTFYSAMVKRALSEGKGDTRDGVALSWLAGDMEHSVMRCVMEAFPLDEKDMVWYFDGLLVPCRLVINPGSVCEMLEDVVRNRLGISCRFDIKDVAVNSLAWSLSPSELSSDNLGYKRWKLRFEKKWCLFDHPAKYGFFLDGKLVFRNKEEFKLGTMTENKEFVEQWKADPNKRSYKSLEFAPPPLLTKPGYFNPWNGFAADSLEPIADHEDVERRIGMYKRHVNLLCGEVAEYEEYVHKLMAFKFQKPGFRWGVMPYFFSAQGVGKDQWFSFICKMAGPDLCYTATDFGDLVGTASSLIDNKLFVCFSEMSAEDSRKHQEKVKRMITSDSMTVEAKYVAQYTNRSCHSFIGFTNNINALSFKSDDRRMVPFQACGRYRNDPEYHGPFHQYINDPMNQRAVYQWLMEMDIEGFEPMHCRPKTEMHAMVADSCKPFADIFLEKKFEDLVKAAQYSNDFRSCRLMGDGQVLEISSAEFTSLYGEFLREMKLPEESINSEAKVQKKMYKDMTEAGARMDKYHDKSKLAKPFQSKHYKDRRCIQFKIDSVREYIKNDLQIQDGDQEDGGVEESKIEISNVVQTSKRSNLQAFHNKPGESPMYVVKDRGETVFAHDDLEEINKYLGEAYVKIDHDGKMILVNQFRNTEIELVDEYKGDYGKNKLEAKYPWYRKSRII
jgi:hypothetical protein